MRSRTVLAVLTVLSLLVGGYEATAVHFGYVVGQEFQAAWSLVFVLLLAFWVDMDWKEHREIYRPFEFGFLVFYFWIPYIPYYLVRTRRARGVLWLVGFVVLFNLSYLVDIAAHAAR
jgi:hypothetical protein